MDKQNKKKLFEELLRQKGISIPGGPVLKKREEPGPYKLSFAQQRIWFLQQFDSQSAAYNDPAALRIQGPLDIAILERTFNEIIRRHKVLRMIFPAREGRPVMTPHAAEGIKISLTARQDEPGTAVEEQVRDYVNLFSRQHFNLAEDFPVRVGVLTIAENDYALVVSIHHIVLDGWSKGLMLQEMMDLYRAFSEGKPSPLRELPVQYTDYVHWQQEWGQSHLMSYQLAYWKKQLSGAPPQLQLPTDYPRPNILTGGGSLEPFSFSQRKLQALNELAKREDATFFMVMLAAYSILLFRYTGQEDILVGAPVAGRNRVELESLIGLFVNTLVIRTDFPGEPGFKELLRRVRQTTLGAFTHQDIPFEKLVEELNPQRSLSVTPLFQVLFQLQNAPMPPARIAGLSINPIRIDTGFSQVDLSLTLWEEEGIMRGTFEYSTDLFEVSTIRRMIGHFQELLDGIIGDGEQVEQPVSRLPMLSREELHRLTIEWNDTDSDLPAEMSIYQMIEACVAQYPDREAVIFERQRLSYSQLDRLAGQLAQYLRHVGVGPEVLVGICLENSLELIIGITGILKAGGGYIPLDPDYPDRRLNRVLRDACPLLLLTTKRHLARFSGYQGKTVCLDMGWEMMNTGDKIANSRPGDVGCVIYTSGSSGEPKGISIENRNIVNLIFSFSKSYRPGPQDRVLPLTSIASASFVGELLPILTSGGGIVLADRVHFLDMRKLAVLLSDYEITILSTVPSMIARLNAVGWRPGKLRLLLSGGETLSPGDIDHLIETVTIVNGYGLTEATICSTYNILDRDKKDFSKNPVISVGRPIINTQVYILDKYRNIVPVGVPGEMYIGGEGISRGYLNNPGLTAEKFNFNRSYRSYKTYILYKTGDLGSWQPDGGIKFLGRIDTQVQVHGHRIELSEIETCLGLHPAVTDVVVLAREIAPGDRRLVAYLVTAAGQKISGSEWRDWLSRQVPEYMIPAYFETLEVMPLTANGKVDVGALPIPSGVRPDLEVNFKAPRTEIERAIAAVWMEYLHLEKVGINDNFFELGGHSLLLTQVHSRLSEMYERDLTVVDMFRYPTIHMLAGYIGQEEMKKPVNNYLSIRERANKQRQALGRRNFHKGSINAGY